MQTISAFTTPACTEVAALSEQNISKYQIAIEEEDTEVFAFFFNPIQMENFEGIWKHVFSYFKKKHDAPNTLPPFGDLGGIFSKQTFNLLKGKGNDSLSALLFFVSNQLDLQTFPEDLPTRAKSLIFVRANNEESFETLIARVNGYTSPLFSYTPEDYLSFTYAITYTIRTCGDG